MKKKLLLLLFITGITKAHAQIVFCPPGAEWHYLFLENDLDPHPYYKNIMVKYVNDLMVDGESVKEIIHEKIFWRINTHFITSSYIKQHGDTVFMKNAITNNQWCILFNYAALPGESWQIPLSIYNNMTYTVTVDSVKNVLINGFQLKCLFATYQDNLRAYSATITERIGGSRFFFNFWGGMLSDGDLMTNFLCYQDDAFGLAKFSSKSCDYSYKVGLDEIENPENNFKIYPNPTTGDITLEYPDFTTTSVLRISNALGQLIFASRPETSEISFSLELSQLEKGIYFLQILDGEKLIATRKIIKN